MVRRRKISEGLEPAGEQWQHIGAGAWDVDVPGLLVGLRGAMALAQVDDVIEIGGDGVLFLQVNIVGGMVSLGALPDDEEIGVLRRPDTVALRGRRRRSPRSRPAGRP